MQTHPTCLRAIVEGLVRFSPSRKSDTAAAAGAQRLSPSAVILELISQSVSTSRATLRRH